MALRCREGLGGCTQGMAGPQGRRDVGAGARHRLAERGRPSAADRPQRDRAGCLDLWSQGGHVGVGGGAEPGSEEHSAGETSAPPPPPCLPVLGLEASERAEAPSLAPCDARSTVGGLEGETAPCLVTRQESGDGARGAQQLALTPAGLHLGDAPVVRGASGADLGDASEAKGLRGQRPAAFLRRPGRWAQGRTRRMEAAAQGQGEPHDSFAGGEGAIVVRGHPQRLVPGRALTPQRRSGLRRGGGDGR